MTYIFNFKVGIVLGPSTKSKAFTTRTDNYDILRSLQHIGQDAVPRTPLGQIEGSCAMKTLHIM
jgi:hypothetical protein